MAVRTKDELLISIKELIGDSTDDKALAIIEDVTDTFKDFETKSGDDWKAKYEENDKAWREKYKERFFNTEVDKEEDDVFATPNRSEKPETPEPKTFDDLFKTE